MAGVTCVVPMVRMRVHQTQNLLVIVASSLSLTTSVNDLTPVRCGVHCTVPTVERESRLWPNHEKKAGID